MREKENKKKIGAVRSPVQSCTTFIKELLFVTILRQTIDYIIEYSGVKIDPCNNCKRKNFIWSRT